MLCCSSVSDVGLVVVAFEAVGCCISVGDVGVRLFCCFVVGVVVSNGLHALTVGWYCLVKLPFRSCSCILKWTYKPSVTGLFRKKLRGD